MSSLTVSDRFPTVSDPLNPGFSPFSPFSENGDKEPIDQSDLLRRLIKSDRPPSVSDLQEMTLSAAAATLSNRDVRGRFTLGCNPGLGRPRKQANRTYVSALSLIQRVCDMDDTKFAWNSIVDRMGPSAAQEFLEDLEAEKGEVAFRHLALEAIRKAIAEVANPQPLRITKKRLSKRKTKMRVAKNDTITKSSRRRRPLSSSTTA